MLTKPGVSEKDSYRNTVILVRTLAPVQFPVIVTFATGASPLFYTVIVTVALQLFLVHSLSRSNRTHESAHILEN